MRLVHIWKAVVGGRNQDRQLDECECGAVRWRISWGRKLLLYSPGRLNGRLTGAWEEAVPPCTRNVPARRKAAAC